MYLMWQQANRIYDSWILILCYLQFKLFFKFYPRVLIGKYITAYYLLITFLIQPTTQIVCVFDVIGDSYRK